MTSVRDDLYIKNAISVALKSFNTAEMALVVDGRYFMFRSKTVYAELVGTQLEFFIREKKIDSRLYLWQRRFMLLLMCYQS